MRAASLLSSVALLGSIYAEAAACSQCKCLPGDNCWPSASVWAGLNSTVGNQLVASEPIGSPCHDPNYDAVACDALKAAWTNPLTHIPSSSSIMQTYFTNQSCDPFTDRTVPCTLGNYVSYAVKVRDYKDVATALKFAKKYNIRVVVRNTGHDFFGRSTGAGALAIWTQNLKSIEFTEWSDEHYTGPAAKVGAGVLGYELVEAANANDLTVVSGECATVGLAGGFTQGGGHSTLSTAFGLGADQTLSFQVVTADGRLVTASPSKNADLYWALSGGGGGTYGIVTEITVRAFDAATVGGASFLILAPTTTAEKFQAAVSKFYELLPQMAQDGAMVVFTHTAQVLSVGPVTAWNSTEAHVRDVILKPFVDAVTEIGITLQVTYSELSFRDHYDRYLGPLPQGKVEVQKYQFGGRLIPRDVLSNNIDELMDVVHGLTASGVIAAGSAGVFEKPEGAENSVNPVWRNATLQLQLITLWDTSASWESMEAAQKRMTDEFMPKIEAVTPGSGSYMNEADFRQPDWQEVFYGVNYDELLSIKQKWDPESTFYTLKGVGSDAWNVAEDGRMCRA